MKKSLQNTFRFIVMLFILHVGKANAVTYTFIGPGTDWSNSANWSGMSLPPFGFIDIGDVLNINSPCVFTPTLAVDAVNNQGVMNINSSFETGATLPASLYGTSFLTDGTINISATGSIQNSDLISSGIINNSGVFTASASNVFIFAGTFNNLSGGIMNNEASTSMDNLCIFNNSGTFNNSSTFNILANTSFLNSGVMNNSLMLTNNGNLQNLSGGNINNMATLVHNGGTFFNNSGATLLIDLFSTLTLHHGFPNNGTLTLFGFVDGSVPLTNNGTITGNNPYLTKGFNQPIITASSSILTPSGSNGKLTIENPSTVQNFDYTTINLSIFNSSTYNSIELSGNASLNGATINVTLDPGYTPANGDVFTFIDANSFTTSSPTLNLPSIPGYTWTTTYLSGNLVSTLNFNIVLPIVLKRFSAIGLGTSNQLSWEVENSSNFSHFEIEKSTDGVHFNYIGKSNMHDNPIYTFIDQNITNSNTYYRLKMVDLDSKFSYSNVVSVSNKVINEIIVLNNPVMAGEKVKIISDSDYEIFNLNGAKVSGIDALNSGFYIVKNKIGKSAKFLVK
jgi:hypothetical protein